MVKYDAVQKEVRVDARPRARAAPRPLSPSNNSANHLPPPPQILAADSAYLSSAPELPAMLAAFTRAVLKEKPADLRAFASAYFQWPKPAAE